MKFVIFFICVTLVHSELHRFMTAYTEISNQTDTRTQQFFFFAVTTLDGHQIDYNDSNKQKLKPKQVWMKKFASSVMWKDYTKIREDILQIYKTNVHVLMEQFNNSPGVHTYQRMYGCDWDDETEETQGFDQHGYDGEDFISLDLKKLRYNISVQQRVITVMKWNNDRTRLESLKRYYDHDCVDWLRRLLYFSEATLKKAVSPKVSLLQEKQGNYTCHVTGFLFRNTIISWRKNGQDLNNSGELVKSGDTLPNEDGTFQRTVALYVLPDECKVCQYTCVVEHKSLTETIQKNMTVDNTTNSKCGSYASYIKEYLGPVIIPVIISVIVLIVLWLCCRHQKKVIDAWETKTIYYENKLLPSGQNEALIPTPTDEHTPLQEPVTSEGADRHRITFQKLHPHSSSPVERSSQP